MWKGVDFYSQFIIVAFVGKNVKLKETKAKRKEDYKRTEMKRWGPNYTNTKS